MGVGWRWDWKQKDQEFKTNLVYIMDLRGQAGLHETIKPISKRKTKLNHKTRTCPLSQEVYDSSLAEIPASWNLALGSQDTSSAIFGEQCQSHKAQELV